MKEESHNPSIDPELEARIVALVLGEASDFERDTLNRLIKERPELAALKDQFQSVHGLLRDVGADESVADDDDWKLSADKRSAVLAVIGGDAEDSAKQVVNKFAEKRRSVKGNFFWNLTKIAAVFCVVGLGSMAMLPFFNYAPLDSARSRRLASNGAIARDSKGASDALWGERSAPSRDFYRMDDGKVTTADERYFRTAEPAAVAEFDSKKNSKSALSAIRDSLDAIAPMPNDDDGPSVTISLDGDGQPVADLELRFDTGNSGATPSFGGFDSGSASTEGVNGPGPPAQPTADNPALIANKEAKWSDDLDADGLRLADSQPTVPTAGNGELSFPTLTNSSGQLNAFDAAEPVRSTIRVPDGGTILRGGIKRLEEGREGAVSGKPTVSSSMTHDYAASESGGESQGAAREHEPALGLDDRPALGKQSENLGFAADGERLGGGLGGFGGGGTVPVDESRNEISAEQSSQEIPQLKSGVLRKTRDLEETPPSQPMVAGVGGGADETDAVKSFDKSSDAARLANSIPSPMTEPTAPKEDFKSKGKLAVSDRYEAELGQENVTKPSGDDIALPSSRTLEQGTFFSRQNSEPVTGTAITKPLGGREAGESKQDHGWGYDQISNGDSGRPGRDFGTSHSTKLRMIDRVGQPATTTRADVQLGIEERAKSSLGEISAFTELDTNTDIAEDFLSDGSGKDVDELWTRPQSELRGEQDGSLSRRGQPASAANSRWRSYVPPMLEDSESMKKAPVKKSSAPAGLNEQTAENEAFSTFSLHVSDVSFKLARTALAHGEWPEAAKVRIEEFVNAFDYGDPMPSQSEKVACCLEQSIHPFLQQRNLLRVSMRTAAAGRSSSTPLRLTLLLDNSGSMERADRQQTVRRAFALLAQQLRPIDQVTLISFARQPRLLADKVSGAQSHQLVQLIDNLPSEGGTNIEGALQLAFEKAQEQKIDDAQNRIILLTDGAVNLGNANPESLSQMVTTMRDAGIAFDAAGISAEGLNDEVLEALTRKGDGRYYLLDSLEAADDGFARQIAGAMRPSAKNVKVQIEFNPKRVGRYKLLGFEKHRLTQEDFRNDKVDAAEMAAAEAGVAVYQFEAKPDGEGDVGSVSVRFRDLSTGQMIENRWPISYEASAPRPDQAAPSLRIATSAALLAAKLRGEPLGETVDLKTLSDLIAGLPDRDRNTIRVQELQLMIQQARQLSGK